MAVLISYFFYNFARVLPHAVLFLILFEKNISLDQIIIIQSFFYVSILSLEIPSGIISDNWCKKKIFIIGVILNILSYLIIVLYSEFFYLCIAWFLYGCSSALISGTIENIVINNFKRENNNWKIDKFTPLLTKVFLYSSLLGGFIGSILFNINYKIIYYLAISIFTISLLICQIFIPNVKEIRKEKKVKLSFKKIKRYKYEILAIGSMGIFTTTFYQFWQLLLDYLGISSNYFGIMYILFQLTGILGTFLFQKKIKLLIPFIAIIVLTVIDLLLVDSSLIFIIAYIISILVFYITNNKIMCAVRKNTDNFSISTIISTGGTVVNIVSLILMSLISIFIDYFSIVVITILLFTTYFVLNGLILKKIS